MVALDRPGYGSSAPYPDAMQHPEQRVALVYGAIDKVLGTKPRGAGLFLVGHSAGCELAVRLAADERADAAGVIGLELAGTGVRYSAAMAEIMKTMKATNRPAGLRDVLWQPAELYPPDVLSGMTNSATGAIYEVGMTKRWPREDFPALAPQVRVPVQFSVAEHERVWQSDDEALTQIGAIFSRAPSFRVNRQPDTGHNMSLSLNAAPYHDSILSFVDEVVQENPVAQQDTSGELEVS
jgi:pimeloyl-ACP methyl ester carboxylesterase